MGVLLGATCLLLLLLMKKEDMKGEWCTEFWELCLAWDPSWDPSWDLTASPPCRLAEIPEGWLWLQW